MNTSLRFAFLPAALGTKCFIMHVSRKKMTNHIVSFGPLMRNHAVSNASVEKKNIQPRLSPSIGSRLVAPGTS